MQKWANWPTQAAGKKWAENLENFRLKRNFPISKKLAELTTKKLTSGYIFYELMVYMELQGVTQLVSKVTPPFFRHIMTDQAILPCDERTGIVVD